MLNLFIQSNYLTPVTLINVPGGIPEGFRKDLEREIRTWRKADEYCGSFESFRMVLMVASSEEEEEEEEEEADEEEEQQQHQREKSLEIIFVSFLLLNMMIR